MRRQEEAINYLDMDEDHMEGNEEIGTLIERQNQHKIKYLTKINLGLSKGHFLFCAMQGWIFLGIHVRIRMDVCL